MMTISLLNFPSKGSQPGWGVVSTILLMVPFIPFPTTVWMVVTKPVVNTGICQAQLVFTPDPGADTGADDAGPAAGGARDGKVRSKLSNSKQQATTNYRYKLFKCFVCYCVGVIVFAHFLF